jgi:uncharacterized membrane protein YhaH (DUF805 family)
MNYYITVLKKYAVFEGRARRAEYWYFVLFNIIIVIVLGIIETMSGSSTLSDQGILVRIYDLAVLIPSIAVGIRRMHDVNKNGWYLLIPLYNLILACTDGTKGDNQYGPDPKATEVK